MEISLGCFFMHSEKFPSVGGGPISMNIPPRKRRGILCLLLKSGRGLVGVGSYAYKTLSTLE